MQSGAVAESAVGVDGGLGAPEPSVFERLLHGQFTCFWLLHGVVAGLLCVTKLAVLLRSCWVIVGTGGVMGVAG